MKVMKKEILKFPVCFLVKNTDNYEGYLESGNCLVIHKKGYIYKNKYYQEFQTKEMYFKNIQELKQSKRTHQEITPERFDEVLNEVINTLFDNSQNEIFQPNLKAVRDSHKFDFGWDFDK